MRVKISNTKQWYSIHSGYNYTVRQLSEQLVKEFELDFNTMGFGQLWGLWIDEYQVPGDGSVLEYVRENDVLVLCHNNRKSQPASDIQPATEKESDSGESGDSSTDESDSSDSSSGSDSSDSSETETKDESVPKHIKFDDIQFTEARLYDAQDDTGHYQQKLAQMYDPMDDDYPTTVDDQERESSEKPMTKAAKRRLRREKLEQAKRQMLEKVSELEWKPIINPDLLPNNIQKQQTQEEQVPESLETVSEGMRIKFREYVLSEHYTPELTPFKVSWLIQVWHCARIRSILSHCGDSLGQSLNATETHSF
ncbi:hypothetical protein EDD86DRAFT_77607 [Gorgonomyces haynaldii]|nr:hypothetical protein EDD86DRAFT_77607 [Gorgonomyces haynaldii]